MNDFLNEIATQQLTLNWLAPFITFATGMLTSLSPCCLSSVSVLITLVSGYQEPTVSKSFRLSLVFVLGATITFTSLGIIGAVIGKLFFISAGPLYILLGIVMILMALQIWELYTFIPSSKLLEKRLYDGYKGAVVCGLFSGFFSAPCCTPVLVAIISLIGASGNILWGILTMLMYAIGHNVISIAAGTSFGFSQTLLHSKKYKKFSNLLKYFLGTVILFLGFYLLYIGF